MNAPIEHALNAHPEAKNCIEQLIVKKEPLELDNGISRPYNVNNPCKVEIMPDIVDQRDPYGLEYGNNIEICDIKQEYIEYIDNKIEGEIENQQNSQFSQEKLQEPLSCNMCNQTFTRKRNLKRHIAIVHEGSKNYKCNKCDEAFADASKLRKHKKSIHNIEPEKPTPFNDKGSSFDMKDHVMIVNEGIKTYQCGICSKKLKSSSKLKVHVITVHEGLKNYKCEECNKCFGTQGVLTTHIERVHKRTETHVCELCGKSYNNPQNLVYHMKVHSGIKEFQCHYCGQEFFSKSCMQLHAKRIHEDFKPHKE